MFSHYSDLPYSLRVLYTAALLIIGMGYLFAMIYIFATSVGVPLNHSWYIDTTHMKAKHAP